MDQKIQEIEKEEIKDKKTPRIKSGDIVKVTQTYTEKDKERHSVFEGVVIKISSGSNTRRTITVRRVIEGVGVEKIIPLCLSSISKIEVLKSSKVRRAKLYYLRDLAGKKARLKDKKIDKDVLDLMAQAEKETTVEKTKKVKKKDSKKKKANTGK